MLISHSSCNYTGSGTSPARLHGNADEIYSLAPHPNVYLYYPLRNKIFCICLIIRNIFFNCLQKSEKLGSASLKIALRANLFAGAFLVSHT